MALFDSELRDEVFLLMELCKLKNYTHFVGLHGSSPIGKKEGNVAWPGTNEIVMMLMNPEQLEQFKSVVRDFKKERKPAPGLITFMWPLSELV